MSKPELQIKSKFQRAIRFVFKILSLIWHLSLVIWIFSLILLILSGNLCAQSLCVGAKHFNEGYILSEIISQLLEDGGYTVARSYNLGGTLICFDALNN